MKKLPAKITILLVDDLIMFRQGLCMLLEHEEEIQIAGEANDGYAAFQLITEVRPDVVITDIQMPEMNGIELTKELKLAYPQLPVIALTMFKEDHLIVDMLEAGAKGYLLKSTNKEKLVEAIKAVYAGGWYYCDSTTLKLSKMIAGTHIEGIDLPQPGLFTDTEVRIVQLICQQLSSKEISAQLHLGERTIESYRHKIFEKMRVKNMAGMVIYAIRSGLFKP